MKRGHEANIQGEVLTKRDTSRKYQFMEQNLQRRVAGLKDKMPDIQKTLDTVRFLKLRKVMRIPIW